MALFNRARRLCRCVLSPEGIRCRTDFGLALHYQVELLGGYSRYLRVDLDSPIVVRLDYRSLLRLDCSNLDLLGRMRYLVGSVGLRELFESLIGK